MMVAMMVMVVMIRVMIEKEQRRILTAVH